MFYRLNIHVKQFTFLYNQNLHRLLSSNNILFEVRVFFSLPKYMDLYIFHLFFIDRLDWLMFKTVVITINHCIVTVCWRIWPCVILKNPFNLDSFSEETLALIITVFKLTYSYAYRWQKYLRFQRFFFSLLEVFKILFMFCGIGGRFAFSKFRNIESKPCVQAQNEIQQFVAFVFQNS